MARIFDYNGATKTPAASTTTIFSGNDLPQPTVGRSVVALHLALTGTGNTLGTGASNSALNRIRVKAGSITFVDLPAAYLRKYLESMSIDNYAPVTAATRFTIPFGFIDERHADDADLMAAPIGMALSVELVYGSASLTTPTVQLGWTLSDVEPEFYPYLGSQATPWIGATGNNQRMNVNEGGAIRGLWLPNGTSGGIVVSEWKFILGDEQVISDTPTLLLETQTYRDPQAIAFTGDAQDCLFVKLEGMGTAGLGGASYVQANVTTTPLAVDEVGWFAVRNQPYRQRG